MFVLLGPGQDFKFFDKNAMSKLVQNKSQILQSDINAITLKQVLFLPSIHPSNSNFKYNDFETFSPQGKSSNFICLSFLFQDLNVNVRLNVSKEKNEDVCGGGTMQWNIHQIFQGFLHSFPRKEIEILKRNYYCTLFPNLSPLCNIISPKKQE